MLRSSAAVGSEKSSRWRTAGIGSDRTALMAEFQAAMMVWQVSRVGSTPVFDGAERLKACFLPDSRRSPARRGRQIIGLTGHPPSPDCNHSKMAALRGIEFRHPTRSCHCVLPASGQLNICSTPKPDEQPMEACRTLLPVFPTASGYDAGHQQRIGGRPMIPGLQFDTAPRRRAP